MNWRQVLLAVFLSQSTVTAISPDHLLVKTDSGWVRGTEEISATGKTVHAFLGIPYAQPPLGRLRFRHPEPVSPWQGVFNGTSLPHSCMQRLLRISFHIPYLRKQVSITPLSEDCLKLNVWVPSGEASDKLPVVVFLHGGGYSFGSSATTVNLGDSLAAEENLIVVTLNYRLASLGFLFLDHPEAPGNYGLYDQRLAMEWIHRNAEAFGGDPSRITLFGQSAGSSSALFHLLSGKSDHLIQRLVLCSPPRVSYVLPDRETSVRKAVELAQNVGCVSNGSDPEAIVRCLRNVDASELISSEPGKDYNNVIYFPIVDGDIVPVDWQRRFSEGRVKGVDILLGSNKNEGTLFLMLFSPHIFQISRDTVSPTFEDYKELLRNIDLKSEPVLKTIEFHYTSWINLEDTSKMFEYSEKTINDVLVGCPTTKYSGILSGNGTSRKVFRYHFVHQAAGSRAPTWFGAFHGTELFYVFGEVHRSQPRPPQNELDFGRRVMRYWANFARSGDPNQRPDGGLEEVAWPQYRPPDGSFLVLSPNSTSTGNGGTFRARHCAFWDHFLPDLVRQLDVRFHEMDRYTGL